MVRGTPLSGETVRDLSDPGEGDVPKTCMTRDPDLRQGSRSVRTGTKFSKEVMVKRYFRREWRTNFNIGDGGMKDKRRMVKRRCHE